MPKIIQNADQYRNKDFNKAVRIRLVQLELEQQDLAKAMDVSAPRACVLVNNPDQLTVDRLRKMITFLGMPPEQVLKFLGYSEKVINKLKEEKKNESL